MDNENTVKIRCETEGFEEATEEVETLVSAYEGFPPNVVVKNCRNCTFNIYPSQTRFISGGGEDD